MRVPTLPLSYSGCLELTVNLHYKKRLIFSKQEHQWVNCDSCIFFHIHFNGLVGYLHKSQIQWVEDSKNKSLLFLSFSAISGQNTSIIFFRSSLCSIAVQYLSFPCTVFWHMLSIFIPKEIAYLFIFKFSHFKVILLDFLTKIFLMCNHSQCMLIFNIFCVNLQFQFWAQIYIYIYSFVVMIVYILTLEHLLGHMFQEFGSCFSLLQKKNDKRYLQTCTPSFYFRIWGSTFYFQLCLYSTCIKEIWKIYFFVDFSLPTCVYFIMLVLLLAFRTFRTLSFNDKDHNEYCVYCLFSWLFFCLHKSNLSCFSLAPSFVYHSHWYVSFLQVFL